MAQSSRLVPRRKFEVRDVIKNVLKNKDKNSDWTVVQNKNLARKIANDLAGGRIWVYGQEFDFGSDITMIDLCNAFSKLKPEMYSKQKGERKLKFKPVFAAQNFRHKFNGQLRDLKPHTVHELLKGYEIQEKLHKATEGHHPDGPAWIHQDSYNKSWISYEVVMDVFSSLCREGGVLTSWPKLLNVLRAEKFKNINVKYAYAALIHIVIRGVADVNYVKLSSNWRKMSQEQAFKYHQDFCNGIPPNTLIAQYRIETLVHQDMVTKEMRHIRAPIRNIKHDYSKFNDKSIFYYTWYWGVWQNLSVVHQNRILAGIPFPYLNEMNCKFTMFSGVAQNMGSSFMDGATAKLEETLDRKTENLDERVKTTVVEAMTESAEKWSDQAAGLMDEFFKKAGELSSSFWGDFSKRTEEVLGSVKVDLSNVSSSLLTLEVFVKQIQLLINKNLASNSIFSGIELSPYTILKALQYYLIYINVNNKFIRGLCFFMMLESVGCISSILSLVMKYLHLFNNEEEGRVGDDSAQFTSFSDSFYAILESPLKVIKIITLVITEVGLGAKHVLSKIEILSLLQKVSKYAKEFHFIGGGILGIERMITGITKLYHVVVSFINTKIFNLTDPKKKLAREILKWIVEVRYFSTERGMTAIRTSKSALERASKLFPRGQALLIQVSPGSDLHDPKLYMDINRYFRESKIIANFITRRNAVTGFQPTMFHIQFVGRPGIGKSTITKRFVRDLISNLWKDSKPDDCWAYNPNLEFFDGYASQKVMIIDDMFRMNEPKHLTTLIGLVTNTPVVLPMANLEDKGIQLTSEVLLSSTNTAYPRGKDILCMEAVHRRRHMLVHVDCDPNVLSKSTGQFELALFNAHYPDQKLEDMPHLKFSLLQPVPQNADMEVIQNIDRGQYTALHAYAQKLKDINDSILVGGKKLDPMCYFSASRAPPSPIQLPCRDWSYKELVSNSVVRFTAFRGMEGRFSKKEKYGHVESALAEIDLAIEQSPDLIDLKMCEGDIADAAAKTPLLAELIERKFGDLDSPFPVYDQIEDSLGSDDLCPEIADLDIDHIIEEFLDSETSSDSFEVIPEPSTSFTSDELDLTAEQHRRNAILKRKQKRVRTYEEVNQVEMKFRDGRYYITTNSSPVIWDELKATQFNPSFAGTVEEWMQMQIILSELNRVSFLKDRKINNAALTQFLSKLQFNSYLKIPNTKQFKPEHRGQKFNMPIELMRRVKVIKGEILLDVTDLEPIYHFEPADLKNECFVCDDCIKCDRAPVLLISTEECMWCPHRDSLGGCRWYKQEHPATITLHRMGKPVKVAPSLGLLFGAFGMYSAFCAGLEMFTTEQVEILSEIAKFRNKYTGFYTVDCVKQTIREIFSDLESHAKVMLSKLSTHILNNIKPFLKVVLSIAALAMVIYLCKSVASVFYPKHVETSKYLHRGPQSNIIKHGRFTSLFNNPRFENMFGGVLRRNLCEITISDGLRSTKSHCLTSGQNLIFNKHALRGINIDACVVTVHYTTETDKEIIIETQNLYQDPNGDLAILWSRNLQGSRSIARYLITNEQYQNLELKSDLFILSRDGDNIAVNQNSPYKKIEKLEFHAKSGPISMDNAVLMRGSTVVGRSGSPVFLSNEVAGSPAMLGIQAWEIDNGFSSSVAIQVITQEKYEDLVKRVDKSVVMRVDEFEYEELEELNTAFTSQIYNSVVCSTDNPAVGLVGKTQFKKTPIADLMDSRGQGSNSVPASLLPSDPLLAFGKEIHPLKHSLAKFNRGNVKALNPKILSYIEACLIQEFKYKLDKRNFSKLNIEAVFSGTHEDGSNPMNLKSSPGIPYLWEKLPGLKGKHSLVNINEEGEVDFISHSLLNDYANFKNDLSAGILPLTLSYDFPKDELRPFEKSRGSVENNTPPKTRTVTCMNMLYIMLWRELTLDMWASFHRLADGMFPLCPGLNPEGPEWNNAFHYLNVFPHALDFDISNWDGFLPPELLFCAGDIIAGLLNYSKNSPEYRQLHGVLHEVMFGYIQFDKFIYQKERGMISGFPGTAEMNSLCHYILLIYIYLNHFIDDLKYCTYTAFLAYIRVLVYGDDVIMTISPEIIALFNGLDIKRGYEDIGYSVTSANKGSVIEKFKLLTECQFLKSDWKELIPSYFVRRMNKDVAINLVYWVRAKEQPQEQFYSNLYDSLRIMFGHGQAEYESWINFLNSMLSSINLPILTYTYMDLYDDYLLRYFNV